jgi:UrcA family protein
MSATLKSALAALTFAAILAPSAQAEPERRAPAVKNVAYGDLDMSTVSGGKILLDRIELAAVKVCGRHWTYSPLQPHSKMDCRRDTVAKVVRQLNIETLTFAWAGPAPTTSMAEH